MILYTKGGVACSSKIAPTCDAIELAPRQLASVESNHLAIARECTGHAVSVALVPALYDLEIQLANRSIDLAFLAHVQNPSFVARALTATQPFLNYSIISAEALFFKIRLDVFG